MRRGRRVLAIVVLLLAVGVAGAVARGRIDRIGNATRTSAPQRVSVTCRSPSLDGSLPAIVYLPAGYRSGSSRYRVIYFLPQVLVTVVVAIVWTWLLAPNGGGTVNAIINLFGFHVHTAWLGDFSTAMISLGLIAVWLDFGLCFVLFLSGVLIAMIAAATYYLTGKLAENSHAVMRNAELSALTHFSFLEGASHLVAHQDGIVPRGAELDVVLLGRRVTAALLGQHVHDDGAVPLGRVREGLLHVVDVVPVDGAGVAHAEGLEERVRRHHVAQGARDRVHARVGQLTQGGQVAQARAQPLARCGVGGVEA